MGIILDAWAFETECWVGISVPLGVSTPNVSAAAVLEGATVTLEPTGQCDCG